LVVKNFRSLELADVAINSNSTIVIGENNTGKTNLIYALRLCLDSGLSSSFRVLTKDDIHATVDQTRPFQVLVGVEFTEFEGKDNEEALLHGTQIDHDRARIFFRFRPRRLVREAISRGELGATAVELSDYGWELVGGGDPAKDLKTIEWNHENDDLGATSVNFQNLQAYLVVFLPALRDVESDLQQTRRSWLFLPFGSSRPKRGTDGMSRLDTSITNWPPAVVRALGCPARNRRRIDAALTASARERALSGEAECVRTRAHVRPSVARWCETSRFSFA
jgi:predicted ATP-dependent endonuclease of OLD family